MHRHNARVILAPSSAFVKIAIKVAANNTRNDESPGLRGSVLPPGAVQRMSTARHATVG